MSTSPKLVPDLAMLAADPSRVDDVPRDALPDLIAALEALRVRLWGRAMQPPPLVLPKTNGGPDRLLTPQEAADRLNVNRTWMYRHADTLPFTRRLGTKTLRFSERGLERWMESRR